MSIRDEVNWKHIKDHSLHILGGAAIVMPMILWPSLPSTFLSTLVWGLLREQAQRKDDGFIGAFFHPGTAEVRWNKVSEAVAWAVGAILAHIVVLVSR